MDWKVEIREQYKINTNYNSNILLKEVHIVRFVYVFLLYYLYAETLEIIYNSVNVRESLIA